MRAALVWGVGIGVLAAAGAHAIEWLGPLLGLDASPTSPLLAGTRTDLLWLAPMAVVSAPLLEEYVFRAWMLERFSRIMPAWLALFWSALAFVAMHMPTGVVPTLELTLGGVLLGLVWLRTRSWLACSLAHGVYNAVVLMSTWMALPA